MPAVLWAIFPILLFVGSCLPFTYTGNISGPADLEKTLDLYKQDWFAHIFMGIAAVALLGSFSYICGQIQDGIDARKSEISAEKVEHKTRETI